MNQKGFSYLIVVLLGLVLIGGGLVYYYFRYLNSLGEHYALPVILNAPSPKDTETLSWKQFETGDVSFRYPPTWLTSDQDFVSQYPYDPKVVTQNVYNLIKVTKVTFQLHPGYLNHDWFNKFYSLKDGETLSNQFYPTDNTLYEKEGVGTTESGQKYILFTESKASEPTIYAHILQFDTIYQLTLTKYDAEGESVFRKLINTIKIS